MNAEHEWYYALCRAQQETKKAERAQAAWRAWIARANEAKSRINPERLADIDDARLERVRSGK